MGRSEAETDAGSVYMICGWPTTLQRETRGRAELVLRKAKNPANPLTSSLNMRMLLMCSILRWELWEALSVAAYASSRCTAMWELIAPGLTLPRVGDLLKGTIQIPYVTRKTHVAKLNSAKNRWTDADVRPAPLTHMRLCNEPVAALPFLKPEKGKSK